MTTPPTNDFKVSADDQLIKRVRPPAEKINIPKTPKSTIVISAALLALIVNQAWIWHQMLEHNEKNLVKVNQILSTIERSRTQVNTIDQQLSETFLQGSAQIKDLSEKVEQLQKIQSNQPTPTTDPSIGITQTLLTKFEQVVADQKKITETHQQFQQLQTQIQQDIAELKKMYSTLEQVQTEQKKSIAQIDAFTQQLNQFKQTLELQTEENKKNAFNLNNVQLNLQELTLQISTLTETATPSEEQGRSLELYRQQVNQRLDQLTETVRKLKYQE